MQIETTGSDTLGNVLSQFGKIVDDGKKKTITLSFEVSSSLSMVKKSAAVSQADTALAMASLTAEEKAIVDKFKALEKQAAAARVQGQESERWKSTVSISKA